MPKIVALVSTQAIAHAHTRACALRYSCQLKLLFYHSCLNLFLNFYMWRIKFTNETCKKLLYQITTLKATILDTHVVCLELITHYPDQFFIQNTFNGCLFNESATFCCVDDKRLFNFLSHFFWSILSRKIFRIINLFHLQIWGFWKTCWDIF